MKLRSPIFMLSLALMAVQALANTSEPNAQQVAQTLMHYGAVVNGVMILFSFIQTFWGRKLLKLTLFLFGFVFGGLLCYVVTRAVTSGQSYEATATIVATLVGGVIAGVITWQVFTLGLFVIGAAFGIVLAMTLNTAVAYRIYPQHPLYVLYALMAVLGLLCGILTVRAERWLVIIGTSFSGAFGLFKGISFFAGGFPNPIKLTEVTKAAEHGKVYNAPMLFYLYLAGIALFFIAGMFVQARITSPEKSAEVSSSDSAASSTGYTSLDSGRATVGKPITYGDRAYRGV